MTLLPTYLSTYRNCTGDIVMRTTTPSYPPVYVWLGRLDLQVKIRGQRVEIEDVERVIDRIIRRLRVGGGGGGVGGGVGDIVVDGIGGSVEDGGVGGGIRNVVDKFAAAANSTIDGVGANVAGTDGDRQQVAVVAVTVSKESLYISSSTIVTAATTTATVLLVAFIETSLAAAVGTGEGVIAGGGVSTAALHRALAASTDMPR